MLKPETRMSDFRRDKKTQHPEESLRGLWNMDTCSNRNPDCPTYDWKKLLYPQEGLRVLQAAGSVFTCHASMLDTIWHSEIGASAALLEAGYNLDCLLAKYQGVDWRNSSFHRCNNGMNPMWEGRYDGTSLNPLEQASISWLAGLVL